MLVFVGQQTLILASDPFATGLDLLGTAKGGIDYSVVSTSAIATVQMAAIVLGHTTAAVGAHDRAVRLLSGKTTVRTQYPLVTAMAALTMGAWVNLRGVTPVVAMPTPSEQMWPTAHTGKSRCIGSCRALVGGSAGLWPA